MPTFRTSFMLPIALAAIFTVPACEHPETPIAQSPAEPLGQPSKTPEPTPKPNAAEAVEHEVNAPAERPADPKKECETKHECTLKYGLGDCVEGVCSSSQTKIDLAPIDVSCRDDEDCGSWKYGDDCCPTCGYQPATAAWIQQHEATCQVRPEGCRVFWCPAKVWDVRPKCDKGVCTLVKPKSAQ